MLKRFTRAAILIVAIAVFPFPTTAADGPKTPELGECRLHTMDDLDEWGKGILGDSLVAGKPSLVSGDLNGDGLDDAAKLLICRENAGSTGTFWFLISFTDSEGGNTPVFSLELGRSVAGYTLLFAIPAGQMVRHTQAYGSDAPDKFLAVNGGVEIRYIGKGAVAYVWSEEDRAILEIPTSD